jgi:hypothetical protein
VIPLKKTLNALLILATIGPATSYALSCKAKNESVTITSALVAALAIPADAPDGTIIWESDVLTADIRCKDDVGIGRAEQIYLWNDPAKQLSIGKGVRLGIRYANNTYREPSRIDTGKNSWDGCNWANCMGWEATFPLQFSVFVEKFGSVPESGQASTLSQYRVFQVDGERGLNTPDKSLNYIVTGLTNIRFIPCSANLTITPSVVNFPSAFSGTAENGKVASTGKFTLGLNKNCDTPYTIDTRFTPVSGSVISELLVPPNNSSIGIKLSRVDNNAVIPFSKWFKLAVLDRSEPESIDFRADLIWRAPPIAGAFEAAVIVDMMYK